jgi:ABC-type transport system involved in multi-copper enzyme maturation permease subunit
VSRLVEIFRFEVRHHLRSPVFWLSSAVFALLSFGAVTSDVVQVGGAVGNVNRNSPFVVQQILLILSIFGVFVTTAFVSGAVLRDHQEGTAGMIFSTPVRKRDFLLGRFAGGFLVSALVFLLVAAAVALGGFMPWLEPERLGPFTLTPYLYTLGFLVLPNLFLAASLFFGLATVTRSLRATYGGVVALFVGYLIAGNLAGDVENEGLAAILDPFGIGAFQIATQYWTPAERNARILGLDGYMLENRLLWLAVGAAVLALTFWRFSFRESATRGAPKGPEPQEEGRVPARDERAGREAAGDAVRTVAAARRDFGTPAAIRRLLHQARFELGQGMKNLAFLVILALGAVNLLGNALSTDLIYGTAVWPRTGLMLQVIEGGFLLFAVLILTLYAGELVWRDREQGTDGVVDALPVRSWVLWGGKLVALLGILAIVLGVAVLTAVAFQLSQGYTDLEPGLYLTGVGLQVGVPFALIAVLALAAQIVTNQKYVGFGVMALYFVSLPVMGALHLEHNLYQYASTPPSPYSDLNGWGHFVEPVAWFSLYWTFGASLLLVLGHLLWIRGMETGWRARLARARRRLTGPVRAVLGIAVVGFVATGGWIFYNTNVLNAYVPSDEEEDRRARYETTYKELEGVPQPKITAVYAEVDIHPRRRALDIRGRYTLRNKDEVAVDSIHLTWVPTLLDSVALELPGSRVVHDDPRMGWRTLALAEPLAPGEEVELAYEVRVRNPGFVNGGSNTDLVHDGTFFNRFQYFPGIGYNDGFELGDPVERRRHGLPEIERMPALEDTARYDTNYVVRDADFVEFETIVSTSDDQVALAPGYLEREWTEDGRRYFHYRMDAPMLGFWAYLSGRWEVRRDRWRDVEIAVYHHPEHDWNVDRMIEAVKASLDYYTRNFSPYQHRQVRIVEFPGYATFAQSFPNTIPYSEDIGFVARLDDPKAIDYPFYVTAHEVAHQWWAYQVAGADVQGAAMTSETMSQYAALMVMEEAYGAEKMRRFLRYELDAYLAGRGGELIEELPLYRVENQGYIHYRKGSLATYAMKDLMGEDAFNRAMAAYVAEVGYDAPPYTTSAELLDFLEGEVPPEYRGTLNDLFRTITLWEMEATDAVASPGEDGRWTVRLDYAARKIRADGEGNETELPLDEWVDVAVFGAEGPETPREGRVLHREKIRVTEAAGSVEVTVDAEPVRAGIDPFNLLIDRNPENNLVRVDGGTPR